eukprot:895977-Amorphochlora_amoeboformis.AAC.3
MSHNVTLHDMRAMVAESVGISSRNARRVPLGMGTVFLAIFSLELSDSAVNMPVRRKALTPKIRERCTLLRATVRLRGGIIEGSGSDDVVVEMETSEGDGELDALVQEAGGGRGEGDEEVRKTSEGIVRAREKRPVKALAHAISFTAT